MREAVLSLTETLRVVVYFLCVAGLMLRVHRGRAGLESLTRPVLRAVAVVALVATMPWWFGYSEKIFLTVADTIQTGYTEHPMRAAAMIREGTTDTNAGFSLRRLEESYFRATFWAATKLIIWLGTLLQFPFLLLQHVLKLLCLLFMPVVLGLFMVPSLEGLAVRYLQQTCAVLAWPVGFAVTELVAYHLWTAFYQNMMVALDLAEVLRWQSARDSSKFVLHTSADSIVISGTNLGILHAAADEGRLKLVRSNSRPPQGEVWVKSIELKPHDRAQSTVS